MGTRRFEMDVAAERATGLLRLAGALLVAACGVWMVLSGPSALGWAAVALVALAALGWIAAWARGRRRIRAAAEHYLELGPEALTLAEGAQRLQIPWKDVRSVEVDEDRLVVLLGRRRGEAVTIQPRYRGIGLHELGEAIRLARDAGAGRSD